MTYRSLDHPFLAIQVLPPPSQSFSPLLYLGYHHRSISFGNESSGFTALYLYFAHAKDNNPRGSQSFLPKIRIGCHPHPLRDVCYEDP